MGAERGTRPPERELELSGGAGRAMNSARAGFLPIAIARVPVAALHGLGVYIRVKPTEQDPECFQLYCAETMGLRELHRRRLLENGVRFVYIRMEDQARFRQQTEASLRGAAEDPAIAAAERAALVYETSLELINELLADPVAMVRSERLEETARSVATLVIKSPGAFRHLFAASHHDFYTATHMVNVGTWLVPLAYILGHHDPDELAVICQAGILHDIGKLSIPEDLLNKPGRLTEEEWAVIRQHPEAGGAYLDRAGGVHPTIRAATLEHHERMDGSGYPFRLRGSRIHPVSRMCAVVDSFDAMTAFRPFKKRTLTVGEAMAKIERETPDKYDPDVVAAWRRLVRAAEAVQLAEETPANRRQHTRHPFDCPGRAHVLSVSADSVEEQAPTPIIAHSLSRSGLGFLARTPVQPGTFLRVYLEARGWESRPLEGQAVRCRSYNDHWHEVGMEFVSVAAETAGSERAAAQMGRAEAA